MRGQIPLFSSERHTWETPIWLVEYCSSQLGVFNLDAAASHSNHKAPLYFTEGGLEADWIETIDEGAGSSTILQDRVIWCNPPYGRVIGDWVRKCYQESQRGATVALLIPARPDTRYWHDYCALASEWWFIKGRLKFCTDGVPSKNAAPFPSVVIIFRPIVNKLRVTHLVRPAL